MFDSCGVSLVRNPKSSSFSDGIADSKTEDALVFRVRTSNLSIANRPWRTKISSTQTTFDKMTDLGTTMFTFLFDVMHKELSGLSIFGPACHEQIIAALGNLRRIPTTQVFWGSVLASSLCYRLGGVSANQPSKNRGASMSQQELPDMQLYKTIICDLGETLSEAPSTIKFDTVFRHIGNGEVWAVTLVNVREDEALAMDKALRRFGPYLGCSLLDLGNFFHRQLFVESMFKGILICEDGIFCRRQLGDFEDEVEDETEIRILLDAWGNQLPSKMISWREFEELSPRISEVPTSERGKITLSRWEGSQPNTHRERVAHELIKFHRDHPDKQFEFSASVEESQREFYVPERKLTEYLLNPNHKDGAAKAQFFKTVLGIELNDHLYLADQLIRGAKEAKLYRIGVSSHGFTHGALMLIKGRNNRIVPIETGWIISEESPAQFVTAYPAKQNGNDGLVTVESCVVDSALTGDDRWAAIHAAAHKFASEVAESKVPAPMVVQGNVYWGGECGFGWVRFLDGRKAFVRWLTSNGHAYKDYRGYSLSSPLKTQSIQKNKAYADAYCYVAMANGIDCKSLSRLD